MKSLLWSLKRELWEHRWTYTVPLLVGAIVVLIFAGVVIMRLISGAAPNDVKLSALFDLASRIILVTGTIAAYVYCAEALHGERRDRAILFWKTWPVSDGTTVAAKSIVALVVIPLVTLALLITAQAIARLILIGKGIELRAPVANPVDASLELIAASLWIAPVYAWIMVVSAWARRAVLFLAFLPLVLVGMIQPMLGGDTSLGHALIYRGVGRHLPMKLSVDSVSGGSMVARPASELLRSFALWAGVGVALMLLAIVVKLRRRMTEL